MDEPNKDDEYEERNPQPEPVDRFGSSSCYLAIGWVRWKIECILAAMTKTSDEGGHRFIGKFANPDYEERYGGVRHFSKCYRCGQRTIDEPKRCK